MIENALDVLSDFDIPQSSVHVWIFKKGADKENERPRYTGRWVESGEQIDDCLRSTLNNYIEGVTEIFPYQLLAQNTEASALHIDTEQTFADLVLEECVEQTDRKRIKAVKHIQNAIFYVVKFVHEESVVYGVKQTDSNWKTKRRSGFWPVMLADQEIELLEADTFEIARDFDFVISGEDIVARNKNKFESVLNYKAAHLDNFEEIKQEQEFNDVFSELAAIEEYVGDNKMQLRRVAAIRQKGYYRDGNFMQSLQRNATRLRLNIEFNDDGKIVPTPETCRDIFQALLDHRLMSHYDHVYDVQNTVPV